MSNELIVGLVDAAVVIIGFLIGRFAAPDLADEIMYVVLALQPVAVSLLIHFFGESVAEKVAAKLRK